MCGKCDNIEGNMCHKCEADMAEVKQQSLYDVDGWWPAISAPRRSINVASTANEAPMEVYYV